MVFEMKDKQFKRFFWFLGFVAWLFIGATNLTIGTPDKIDFFLTWFCLILLYLITYPTVRKLDESFN